MSRFFVLFLCFCFCQDHQVCSIKRVFIGLRFAKQIKINIFMIKTIFTIKKLRTHLSIAKKIGKWQNK